MRRYVFYLAVALLAFGIGSSVAVMYYRNNPNNVSVSSQKTFTIFNNQKQYNFLAELRKPKIENNTQHPQEKTEFTCKNANLLAVWKYLLKDKDFREYSKDVYSNRKKD